MRMHALAPETLTLQLVGDPKLFYQLHVIRSSSVRIGHVADSTRRGNAYENLGYVRFFIETTAPVSV